MKIVILNPLEINIDKYLNNEILKKHKVIYNKNKVSDQKK